MSKLLNVCLVITFILGLIGCIFVATIFHEYSHMRDMRNTGANISNETITINIPLQFKNILDTGGMYSVKVKEKDYDWIQEEMKYTEHKAYLIDTILISVFLLAVFIIIYEIKQGEKYGRL